MSARKKSKLFLGLVVLVLAMVSLFFINNNLKFMAAENQTFARVPVPGYGVSIEKVKGGEKVVAENFSSIGSSGNPDLPVKSMKVLIPASVDPKSVQVSLSGSQSYELPGNHEIAPVPPIAADIENGEQVEDWGTGKNIQNGKNTKIYQANSLYPKNNIELINVGNMRQYKVATVNFYPYQYNPQTKKLIRNSEGDVIVNYKKKASISSLQVATPTADSANFRDLLPGFIDNSSEINNLYPEGSVSQSGKANIAKAAGNSRGGYLILTTNSIVSKSQKLQTFKAAKEGLGYSPVTIVTETQWGGGTGNTASEKIRSWLKSNYSSYTYALLIGNPDPNNGDVPMKMSWPRRASTTYQEAPTDLYYADLDSNWDANGNGYVGEDITDSPYINQLPEIFVGRIPFYPTDNATILDEILQKSIAYENGEFGVDWAKKVLYAGKPSDSNTPGYHLGETIKRDVATPAGMPTIRVLEKDYGLVPTPEYIPTTIDNVMKAWQTNNPGFVFWWTHGNETTAASIISSSTTSNFTANDKNHPAFVFQCSCLNGSPEQSNNLGYSLLKTAAVGTISATRVSWYFPGEVDYTNSDTNAAMTYLDAKFLISEKLAAGPALYKLKTANGTAIWMNHLVFNLYGDPSLGYLQKLGPDIRVDQLINTDNTATPYEIKAKVFSNFAITGDVKLKWNTNGGSTYNTVVMSKVSEDNYSGKIDAKPLGTKIYYYIEASDTKGTTVEPITAPTEVFNFTVSQDTSAPVVTSQDITDTAFSNGPYIVSANITDDRGVGSAKLYYSLNGSADTEIGMTGVGTGQFEALIPGPRSAGDNIGYHIVATDSSQSQNQTRYPASGKINFSILPVQKVAIYNSTAYVPYFNGSNSNFYQAVSDTLTSDSKQRFEISVLTDLTEANLADKSILVFPDNGPQGAAFGTISNWFTKDKTIMLFDTSVTYAAYTGLFWPQSGGSQNYGWEYGAGVNDQKIVLEDSITADYKLGDIINSSGYHVDMVTSKLPTDAKVLTTAASNASKTYVAYRDIPTNGRMILFGPYFPSSGAMAENQRPMIRNAAASLAKVIPVEKDTQPPTTPTGLVLTVKNENTVSIAWNPSTDNVAVSGYKVLRDSIEIGDVSTTAYSNTGLSADTKYTYQIMAYDSSGNFSSKSSSLEVTTDPKSGDTTPPSVPQALSAYGVKSDSLYIVWSQSTDDLAVVGYNVFRNNQQIASVAADAYNYQDNNLSPDTTYTYFVSAFDAAGNVSEKSQTITVKTMYIDTTPPSVPQNLQVMEKTTDSITFKWDASTDNYAGLVYRIYRDGTFLSVTGNTFIKDTRLIASGTTYNYTVSAFDASGNESTQSSVLSVTTDKLGDAQPPSVPIGLKVSSKTYKSINVSWAASTDNVGVTGYKVYRNNSEIATTATASYNDDGLNSNTTYTYQVAAYDEAGNVSGKSGVLTVTTDVAQVTNVQVRLRLIDSKLTRYVSNAKVTILETGQTMPYNSRTGWYVNSQLLAQKTVYNIRIEATGYVTQTIKVDTSLAKAAPGLPPGVIDLSRNVYMARASVISRVWTSITGWFR